MPFGGGPRKCVGDVFATYEVSADCAYRCAACSSVCAHVVWEGVWWEELS